jgi:PAS domain S-box-containing protein
MKLRTHFLLTVAITLLPLLVFAIVAIVVFEREEGIQVRREFLDIARALLSAVELQQASSISRLQALATSGHLDRDDLRSFAADAERILESQPDWLNLVVTLPSGRSVVNLARAGDEPPPVILELDARQEPAGPARAREVAATEPRVRAVAVAKGGGELRTFAARVPVIRGETVKYVLQSTASPSVIGRVLLAQRLPRDSVVLILDADNFLVTTVPAFRWSIEGVAPPDLVAAMGAAPEGWFDAPPGMSYDGAVAFVRSPSSHWAVAVGAPAAFVMAPARRSLLLVAAVAACALLGYLSAGALASRVARPLLSLVTAVQALSRGRAVPAQPTGAVSEVHRAVQAVADATRAIEARDAALRESEARFRQLADNVDAVFWITDLPERRVAYVSPAYERLWGTSARRLQEDPEEWIRLVHPDDRARAEALFVEKIHEGPFDVEYRIITPAGQQRWVRDRGFPLRDETGVVRRVAGIAEDVTERKRVEMTLAENRMVLALALDTAQIGVWDHDFITDELRMDATARALFGFAPDTRVTHERWMATLHPDDRGRVDAARQASLRQQSEFAAEYRVVGPDGAVRWVASVGRGWFHQLAGAPLRMIGVVLDVTERRQAEEERAALLARERTARADAEAANRIKDEFLAMLGHELRNPLGAISNAVAVLGDVGSHNPTAIRLREIVARQTRHLTRLIDDLLDVSRLTSGKIALERERVNLWALAGSCLSSLEAAGRTTAHKISFSGRPVFVEGDPSRLEQVIANLVDNAVKYTAPGGSIRVSVGPDNAQAVIRVQDTGVGITPELLARVFELFVQDRQSLHRAGGGLGLGLTLVKRLVDLHGGTVEAASDGPGEGATFVVRLPISAGSAESRPPPAPPVAASAARRVLVVEDHQDARDSLRLLLALDGHEVDEAADGVTALEKIVARRPDVALVDIGLPSLDGYSIARAVRAAPQGKSLFLVALTGYGQPEDRQRAIDAGFDAHLVKPVEPDRLRQLLAAPTRPGDVPADAGPERPAHGQRE